MSEIKIKVNVDAKGYKRKPSQDEAGAIRNRVCSADAIREETPRELIKQIENGQTFTLAEMTGTTGENWKSQQIINADIDNTREIEIDGKRTKVPLDDPLTTDEAKAIMKAHGITPHFMYFTFSHADSRKKWGIDRFRIILVLDEPLTDREAADTYGKQFIQIFNDAKPGCADTGTADNARLLYGGPEQCTFYYSGETTSAATLEALPELHLTDAQKDTAKESRAKREEREYLTDDLKNLDDRYYKSVGDFNIGKYVLQKYGGRQRGHYINPCPICGHNGCFAPSIGAWYCFSSAHGTQPGAKMAGYGGDIITLLALMNENDVSTPSTDSVNKAIKQFKYEIMGWDEAEEKVAYAAEQAAKEKTEKAAREWKDIPLTPITDTDGATHDNVLEKMLGICRTREYQPIRTGVNAIDRALNGGFTRKQLVMVGAAPGAGKTTLMQWLLEGVASGDSPQDVLYINMEMSRDQLLARSLSRILWERMETHLTSLEIMRGYQMTEYAWGKVEAAAKIYEREILPHFDYNPPGVSAKMTDILKLLYTIGEACKAEGRPAPIVCIDYLQILDVEQVPEVIDNTLTIGKVYRDPVEGLKASIKAFKDFCIRYSTVVITIMANNRASNKSGVADMESGRDTSAIEYSADIMIGLTYTAIDEKWQYFQNKNHKGHWTRLTPVTAADCPTDKNGKPKTTTADIEIIRNMQRAVNDGGIKDDDYKEAVSTMSCIINKIRFGQPQRRAILDFDGKHSTFRDIQADMEGDFLGEPEDVDDNPVFDLDSTGQVIIR